MSALALITSVCIFLASFMGLSLDAMHIWPFVLHLGIFALLIPMCVIEYPSMARRTFFSKEFADGKPPWVVPISRGLAIFFVAHFILFLVLSHLASPGIANGPFVLNDHGTIKKILTRPEYLRLKGYELRLFAAGWIFFYYMTTAYWWFPPRRISTSPTV
jgi:hypothetical protein